MDRVLTYFQKREWAAAMGVLGSVVIAMPAILEFISGELDQAGTEWEWSALVPILVGLATRAGVFSTRSVEDTMRNMEGDFREAIISELPKKHPTPE